MLKTLLVVPVPLLKLLIHSKEDECAVLHKGQRLVLEAMLLSQGPNDQVPHVLMRWLGVKTDVLCDIFEYLVLDDLLLGGVLVGAAH